MQENHKHILNEVFNLSEFRRGQTEIIDSVLAGNDVLAVLPTGGGKSLCYQFPAVLKKELVIVVSPLIALMKDQVAALAKRGIPAGCLHSGQSLDEKRVVFAQMAAGGTFLLYLSPERVQKEGFQRWFKNQKIGLMAIDEAHCVSQWGHDFREEYAQLMSLKELRPEIPTLALTASATPLVLRDISKHLGLKNPVRHVYGFYRPNLYYQVQACDNYDEKMEFVLQALQQNLAGRIIIYCGTRKVTESVAQTLEKQFDGVAFYHAGLEMENRHQIQSDYEKGTTRILVSTNAFGMGVDHPDVRLVIHFNMPANIDSLYQEMGRAGRDGAHSTCLMLFDKKDKGLQAYFIESSTALPEIKKARWNTLNALLDYSESGECRHAGILTYYKDSQRLKKCGHCDVCDSHSIRKIQRPAQTFVQKASSSILRKKTKSAIMDVPLNELEQIKFEMLREWRKSRAEELDVPAFVILSDKSLRAVAKVHPTSLSQLEKIHGFGAVKLDRFGKEVLSVLGN